MHKKIGLAVVLLIAVSGSCFADYGYVWVKAKKEDDLKRGVKEIQDLVEGKQGKILQQINRVNGLVNKNFSVWVAVSAPKNTIENLFGYCEGDVLGEISITIRYYTKQKRNSVQWNFEKKFANFEEAAGFIQSRDLLSKAGAEKLLKEFHPTDRELDELLKRQGDRTWDLTVTNIIKGESSKVLTEYLYTENIPGPADEL